MQGSVDWKLQPGGDWDEYRREEEDRKDPSLPRYHQLRRQVEPLLFLHRYGHADPGEVLFGSFEFLLQNQ